MSQLEKEQLELKKKQISVEDEEKKKAKAEKAKKVLIDIEDIMTRASSLHDTIYEIKKAQELSDQDVRQHLIDSKRWETKVEDISSSKVKVDKDTVGLEIDTDTVTKLNSVVEKVRTAVKEKIADLKKADQERCLYSLTKPVKDVAVYPPPFGGNDNEDVYKFKEKMLEAITTNQIREKDKVEVLRKYLKSGARTMVGDHCESIDKAFEALLNHYGLARKTWNAKVKMFLEVCKKPTDWVARGTKARRTVLTKTCDFIRAAEKLSKDHTDLKGTIISHATNEKIFEVAKF